MLDFLNYASSKYYEGNPIISDSEFDLLAEEFAYTSVGASVDTTKAIKHQFPLYSLKKYLENEELPNLGADIVKTSKLDGAAVSLLYAKGSLVLALTRGDGTAGYDVTDKLKTVVPNKINNTSLLQIGGELLASKDISNSRNVASGALNLKSVEEFKSRDLTFVAYSVQPMLMQTYLEDMELLKAESFNIITESEWLEFPHDGIVYRINNNSQFMAKGFTSSYPHGAYAVKKIQERVKTKLINVIWQVGRSGVVAPVAILEPVNVGGALVSRATLHNFKYIEDLDLCVGCEVEIIRAGEIIPRVIGRIYENNTKI